MPLHLDSLCVQKQRLTGQKQLLLTSLAITQEAKCEFEPNKTSRLEEGGKKKQDWTCSEKENGKRIIIPVISLNIFFVIPSEYSVVEEVSFPCFLLLASTLQMQLPNA